MRKLLIIAALFLSQKVWSAPLINGNQINPNTFITVSTVTVTGNTGLTVTTKATIAGNVLIKSGNIGINTLTPAQSLDVEGDAQFGTTGKSTFTTTGLLVMPNDTGININNSAGNPFSLLRVNASDEVLLQSQAPGFPIIFRENPTEAMRIVNNRVGISTQTPGTTLDVNGKTTIRESFVVSNGSITVIGADQNNARIRINNNTGTSWSLVDGIPAVSNNGFSIYDNTTSAARLYIAETSGGVGVNATNICSTCSFQVSGSTFVVGTNGIVSTPSHPYVMATVGTSNLTNGVASKLFFSAPGAGENTQNMYGGATSSGTFTVPAGGNGNYTISMHLFTGAATTSWIIDIYKNGGAYKGCYTSGGGNNSSNQCSTTVPLVGGDTIEVYATQSTGTDVLANTNSVYSYITIEKTVR